MTNDVPDLALGTEQIVDLPSRGEVGLLHATIYQTLVVKSDSSSVLGVELVAADVVGEHR